MKYLIVFWLFTGILSGKELFCQTTISGNIPGGANFHLRFIYYDDFISQKKKILFDTVLDKNGDFKVIVNDKNNRYGKLELVPYYQEELYLEAGKAYHLSFDTVRLHKVIRPFYQKQVLRFAIQDTAYYLQNDLERINSFYSDYLENNYRRIFFRHQYDLIDSLENTLQEILTGKDNLTIQQTLAYKIALLKLTAGYSERKKEDIFRHYIDRQDILYGNQAYMEFFVAFFKDYFLKNKYFSFNEIAYIINSLEDNTALQDTLGKDPLLRNERIRELASLVNLKTLYRDRNFSKKAILKILNRITIHSKFAVHRKIAKNLSESLPALESGTKAPAMKVFSLDSLPVEIGFPGDSSHYNYVVFFISHRLSCLKELQKIDTLNKRKDNNIRFIAISLDEELQSPKKLLEKFPLSFPVYWNGWNSKLIDDYKIRTFPEFLSVSPEGKIIRYPEDAINPEQLELEHER